MREIRQNLSVFLRRIRAGETFTVTDHGRPVALLIPVPGGVEDPLADLVAAGRVLAGPARTTALPPPARPREASRSATAELIAERGADPR